MLFYSSSILILIINKKILLSNIWPQKNGAVVSLSDELPQCYVLADGGLVDAVYLSELSSAAMRRRSQKMVE